MLTFNHELRPAYQHAWKNFVTNTTQTQYSHDEEAYHLKVNLPGFRPEDIELSVDKNILELSVIDRAEAESQSQEENATTASSSWKKRYQLPEDVDVENIEAKLEYGQLLITLNKKPQAKAIKIAIQS